MVGALLATAALYVVGGSHTHQVTVPALERDVDGARHAWRDHQLGAERLVAIGRDHQLMAAARELEIDRREAAVFAVDGDQRART